MTEPFPVKLDLTNCDREPIHIPGHVQPHGVLLVLDPGSLEILQASDNTQALLGIPVSALPGQPVAKLLGDSYSQLLATAQRNLADNPLFLFTVPTPAHGAFNAIAHVHQGLLMLELEPVANPASAEPDFYGLLKGGVARFQASKSVNDFCQLVTDEVRLVSGYDRVMVYKFRDDWSGHVIAESMTPDLKLESYLGLHYPASDIPAQTRALLLLNTVRMLVDTRYRPAVVQPERNPLTQLPLDMSFTFLRGASRMYTEYLANMGVEASLTLAISQGETLWGLVACHHYSPRHVSYQVRSACEVLARVVSLQVGDRQLHDERATRKRIAAAHERLIRAVAQRTDEAEALVEGLPIVADLVDCGGAAVLTGDRIHLVGKTPSDEEVRALAGWLDLNHREGKSFWTDALPALHAPAQAYRQTACGLFAVAISHQPGDWVLWFRPEYVQTVSWAGDPSKPVEVGPLGDRLTPRKSFELWQAEVRGQSERWSEPEIESAHWLRISVVELGLRHTSAIARINVELARSNAELDSFAYVAGHDLKEPLRGIYNYANFVLEDSEGRLDDEGKVKLQTIVTLSKRMQQLIDSLLSFARLSQVPLQLEPIDLNDVVAESIDALGPRLRESGLRVEIPRPLPTLVTDRTALSAVYTNLLTNAAKYNDKAVKSVELGFWEPSDTAFPPEARGAAVCLFVKDNGIGIPAQHQEDVFHIFKRLHLKHQFGGGTGVGLTIVRKLVERHGGAIWVRSEVGEGSTFCFTLGKA